MACPQGFDFVQTAAGGACAFHGRAPCLGGYTDASGQFVCNAWDFECPPGSSLRPGSPQNWCFFDGSQPRVGALFSAEYSDAAKTIVIGAGLLAVALIWLGSKAARKTSRGFSEQAGRMLAGRITGGASEVVRRPAEYSSYEPKTARWNPPPKSGVRGRSLSFSDFPTYDAYAVER